MLAEARKANPDNLNLLILSGVAARMTKKMKPAEDYFVEALRDLPGNGDVINQLAPVAYRTAGQAKRRSSVAVRRHQLATEQSRAPTPRSRWPGCSIRLGRAAEAEQALRNGIAARAISAPTAATWLPRCSPSRIAPERRSRF